MSAHKNRAGPVTANADLRGMRVVICDPPQSRGESTTPYAAHVPQQQGVLPKQT
jgi:hypothetical protein